VLFSDALSCLECSDFCPVSVLFVTKCNEVTKVIVFELKETKENCSLTIKQKRNALKELYKGYIIIYKYILYRFIKHHN
jgi:hypothetical protein